MADRSGPRLGQEDLNVRQIGRHATPSVSRTGGTSAQPRQRERQIERRKDPQRAARHRTLAGRAMRSSCSRTSSRMRGDQKPAEHIEEVHARTKRNAELIGPLPMRPRDSGDSHGAKSVELGTVCRVPWVPGVLRFTAGDPAGLALEAPLALCALWHLSLIPQLRLDAKTNRFAALKPAQVVAEQIDRHRPNGPAEIRRCAA